MITVNSLPIIHCIVVCAGVGKRFGSAVPKQYCQIGDKTVVQHSLVALSQVQSINTCYLVVAKDDEFVQGLDFALPIHWVEGGEERINSVWHGVQAVWQDVIHHDKIDNHWVLIHDAGRPCVKSDDVALLIDKVCQANHQAGGLLAVPVRDTVKQQIDNVLVQKYSEKTLDRSQLWLAQTPQIFPLQSLYDYLKQAIAEQIAFTDEASLFEYFGQTPMLVEGSHSNIKLTFPEDLLFAKAFL